MSLRVAIYASPLRSIGTPTGVGQHIVGMANRLAQTEELKMSILATRSDYAQIRPKLTGALAALPVHFLPNTERLVRATLILTNLLSIERYSGELDWVYSPKEQPVATRRARLAVTVHDMLAFEKDVPGLRRKSRLLSSLRWRLIMRRILGRADLIAVVSEFTRRRLIEIFGIGDDKRLVVTGNGIDPCYFLDRLPSDVELLDRFGLAPQNYLLTIGSLTYRKGGDLLLALARKLRQRKLPWRVVVTGRRHDAELVEQYKSLKADDMELPLDLTGYISNGDQTVLLRNALLLAFPSRYEGFGIPVLEAMAAGTPVVCRPAAALPEVAGDAALFVDRDEPDAWVEQAKNIADRSDVRCGLIDAGRRRAADFTWDRCASRLVAAMSAKG